MYVCVCACACVCACVCVCVCVQRDTDLTVEAVVSTRENQQPEDLRQSKETAIGIPQPVQQKWETL